MFGRVQRTERGQVTTMTDSRTPDPSTSVERTSLDDLEGTPHAAVFEQQAPRTVRLELDAGEAVPRHRHPDANVVLFVVRGRLDVEIGGETHRLEGGEVVRFDGEQEVSPRATEASTALVVLSPKAE